MARDRKFQAILPLRGKILNVERQDDTKLYKNNEISNLIIGLGLGLKGESIRGLRYGKERKPYQPWIVHLRQEASLLGAGLPGMRCHISFG